MATYTKETALYDTGAIGSGISTARSIAEQKRRTFTMTPTPPYDVGDLWVQGEEGDIMRCKAAKASGGSYDAADWEPASKYTDDSAVNALETVVNDMSTVLTAADRAAADALNATAQIRSDLAVVQETDEGVRSWMTFREEGGIPVLRLGTDSSAVYAVFTNDRLEFRVEGNEDPVAYIAADENGVGKLYATNSVVVNEMQFGDWAWYQRPNGNMSVKWTGEEE